MMIQSVHGAGDMVNIIHIVPRVSAHANDVPMWYGVYELPLEMPAAEDVVRDACLMRTPAEDAYSPDSAHSKLSTNPRNTARKPVPLAPCNITPPCD